jgi:hypothetical protein
MLAKERDATASGPRFGFENGPSRPRAPVTGVTPRIASRLRVVMHNAICCPAWSQPVMMVADLSSPCLS